MKRVLPFGALGRVILDTAPIAAGTFAQFARHSSIASRSAVVSAAVQQQFKIPEDRKQRLIFVPERFDLNDRPSQVILMNFFKLLTNQVFGGYEDSNGDYISYNLQQDGNKISLKDKSGVTFIGVDFDKENKAFLYSDKFKDPLVAKGFIATIFDSFNPNEGQLLKIPDHYGAPELREIYSNKKIQAAVYSMIGQIALFAPEVAFEEMRQKEFLKLTSDEVAKYRAEQPKHIPENLNTDDPLAVTMVKFLEHNRGLIFGNDHGDNQSIKSLSDSLPDLSKAGVKNLCVEFSSDTQFLFDKFNKDGNVEELMKNLHDVGVMHVFESTSEGSAGIRRLFQEAFKVGIKIIPVDQKFTIKSSESLDQVLSRRMESSDDVMAYNIVSKTAGEKFVYLVGAAHSAVAAKLGVPMLAMFNWGYVDDVSEGLKVESKIQISPQIEQPFQADMVIRPEDPHSQFKPTVQSQLAQTEQGKSPSGNSKT